MASISSLTLTIEIMEFTEVHTQVGYVSQNYPFIGENLKWRREWWHLCVQLDKWFEAPVSSVVVCGSVFVEL